MNKQVNLSGSLFTNESGNVGIGTTSPDGPLDVTHTRGTWDGTAGIVSQQSMMDDVVGLGIYAISGQKWNLINAISPNPAYFVIRDATAGTSPFLIEAGASDNTLVVDSTGNVGIGTTTPGRTLDVVGDASINGQLISNQNSSLYFGRTRISESPLALNNDSFGSTWTQTGSTGNWRDIAMSSDGKYQTAVIYGGYIYISSDYGSTWTQTGSSGNWEGIAMSSDGRLQTAVIGAGYIYISSDYGITWTQKGSSESWWGIAMSSDGRLQTAVIGAGYIYISSDYGITWTQTGSTRYWRDVAMSSNGMYQTAITYNNYTFVSTDYGITWTQATSFGNWYGIAMSSDGKYQTMANYTGYIYISYMDSYISGGNVGIGTESPDAQLHIESATPDLWIKTNAGINDIKVGEIRFISDVDARNARIEGYRGSSSEKMGLKFFTYKESEEVEAMIINDLGNVGIGTDSPSQRLEVSESSEGITFNPESDYSVMNTTGGSNLTITSSGGNVIIRLGL